MFVKLVSFHLKVHSSKYPLEPPAPGIPKGILGAVLTMLNYVTTYQLNNILLWNVNLDNNLGTEY